MEQTSLIKGDWARIYYIYIKVEFKRKLKSLSQHFFSAQKNIFNNIKFIKLRRVRHFHVNLGTSIEVKQHCTTPEVSLGPYIFFI